jgi:hypothetical protein
LKKSLISLTDRQDSILRSLSEELEMSLSEIVRRAVDQYIETQVREGALARFTLSVGENTATIETPKEAFKSLCVYMKANSKGAVQLLEHP